MAPAQSTALQLLRQPGGHSLVEDVGEHRYLPRRVANHFAAGWIDSPSLFVVTYIPGTDERSRMLRRSIIRYLLCFQLLVFRDISTAIRDRFPSMETFVPAGERQR